MYYFIYLVFKINDRIFKITSRILSSSIRLGFGKNHQTWQLKIQENNKNIGIDFNFYYSKQ